MFAVPEWFDVKYSFDHALVQMTKNTVLFLAPATLLPSSMSRAQEEGDLVNWAVPVQFLKSSPWRSKKASFWALWPACTQSTLSPIIKVLPASAWCSFIQSNVSWWRKRSIICEESCFLPQFSSIQFSSIQFSRSVVSDSLRPHESQHARPPCKSPTPRVYSNPRPSSWWCHPNISSSVVPFSSCPQSVPASGSFPMSQLFAWGGQSTGVSTLASVIPMFIG